jgi:hypothetical protein
MYPRRIEKIHTRARSGKASGSVSAVYPTPPSKLTPRRFCASTANAMDSLRHSSAANIDGRSNVRKAGLTHSRTDRPLHAHKRISATARLRAPSARTRRKPLAGRSRSPIAYRLTGAPERQGASGELASRPRELGTASACSLTDADPHSRKDVSATRTPFIMTTCHHGFTCLQLGSNFSWHKFRRWLPTACVR